MEILWIILAAAFLCTELATVALVSLWFVVGSLAALVACLLGAELWLQVLIFGLVSMGMLLLLRPFLRRFVDPHKVRTNVDAVIGKEGVVTEAIDNLLAVGTVKLDGLPWTARSEDGRDIPEGTVVSVRSVEGVKLIVVPTAKHI
jgi:membrane protein implicated in regulation of membrane protease activity